MSLRDPATWPWGAHAALGGVLAAIPGVLVLYVLEVPWYFDVLIVVGFAEGFRIGLGKLWRTS
jgi:hypothetical protein